MPDHRPTVPMSMGDLMKDAGYTREFLSPREIAEMGPFYVVDMELVTGGRFGDQIVYHLEWRDDNGQMIAALKTGLSAVAESRQRLLEAFQQHKGNGQSPTIGPVVFISLPSQIAGRKPMWVFRDARSVEMLRGELFEGVEGHVVTDPNALALENATVVVDSQATRKGKSR